MGCGITRNKNKDELTKVNNIKDNKCEKDNNNIKSEQFEKINDNQFNHHKNTSPNNHNNEYNFKKDFKTDTQSNKSVVSNRMVTDNNNNSNSNRKINNNELFPKSSSKKITGLNLNMNMNINNFDFPEKSLTTREKKIKEPSYFDINSNKHKDNQHQTERIYYNKVEGHIFDTNCSKDMIKITKSNNNINNNKREKNEKITAKNDLISKDIEKELNEYECNHHSHNKNNDSVVLSKKNNSNNIIDISDDNENCFNLNIPTLREDNKSFSSNQKNTIIKITKNEENANNNSSNSHHNSHIPSKDNTDRKITNSKLIPKQEDFNNTSKQFNTNNSFNYDGDRKLSTKEGMEKLNAVYKHFQDKIVLDKKSFICLNERSVDTEYDFREKIGCGSYGKVYKVVHKVTGITRALKIIRFSSVNKNNIIDSSFINEVNILVDTDHPLSLIHI